MEQIRAFIAVELPGNIHLQLKSIQEKLKLIDASSAKWVDPDIIHLTLKFLGNITPLKVSSISKVISNSISGTSKFDLYLGSSGAFPDKKRVRVIWVGIDGDLVQLNAIQKELDNNLCSLGYEKDPQAFRPHLTLARVYDNVSPARRQVLGNALDTIAIDRKISFQVNSIVLFKSELTRNGPIYTKMNSITL